MIIGWAWVQAGDKLMGIFFFSFLLFSLTKIIILRQQDCQASLTQVILTLGPDSSDFPIHGLLGYLEPKSWWISYLTSNSPTEYGFTSLLFLFLFHPQSLAGDYLPGQLSPKDLLYTFPGYPAGKAVKYMVKSMGSEFRLPKNSFQPCHSPVAILGKIINFSKPQFSQL